MRPIAHWLSTRLALGNWSLRQPEQDQVASVSRAFLTVILGFVVLHVLLVGVGGHNRDTRLFTAAVAGCMLLATARILLGLGWVRTGTWLGVGTTLAVGLFSGWFAAYIGVGQSAWVFVGVAYGTLVLGFRAGAIATGVALVGYAVLAVAIDRAAVQSQIVPHPFNQWLNLFTPSMVLLVAMGAIREALVTSVRRQVESSKAATRERDERLGAIRAAADTLERTVRDRTSALENAVQDLQTLTYLLSHDLMGKVSAMRSFAAVVAEREGDRLTPDGLRRLGRVDANGQELQTMIEGLLTYARASTLQPSVGRVPLGRLLAEIAADMQQVHPKARIEWSVEDIDSDRVMLRHILQNLVANGCKFGARDGAHVQVTSARQDGETVITVSDDGIGFDPAEQERLFELFHRGEEARGAEGHGVGLAVVKHLVQRLGGRVWAETGASGTRFRFTVPDAPQPAA